MVEPIQGLRTSLQMADAADAVEVLKNLNLDIRDLEKIRGIAAEGVLPEDITAIVNFETNNSVQFLLM